MSGTLTVKELIKELLDCDMDEPVFIGLGSQNCYSFPTGYAGINSVNDLTDVFFAQQSTFRGKRGVYLMTRENLGVQE